ncbi:hypothetical protein EJ06DRAFT_530671 [Trichodelitschia bisporula]|uniref:Ribosome assembly protein 3 n=1 Tax=Trichodelitschia bisporula TaxID=703511 RepID=A0A6G1HVX4_9PEZI|nr:hypothetical protein EJ06DRAFT_530671 [Trichodelitschia bisporula]
MAAQGRSREADQKRSRRKRKSRTTDFSDDSSSSSDSDSGPQNQVEAKEDEAALPNVQREPKIAKKNKKAKPESKPVEDEYEDEEEIDPLVKQQKMPAVEGFSSFYLRQITSELDEDLDKIRSAADFKDSSLPLLIHALGQGESLFSEEEKRRIMGLS